jgi:y4mF family transcriptional regulator
MFFVPERVQLARSMYLLHPIRYNLPSVVYIRTRKGIDMDIATFVKQRRKAVRLTQPELAEKAGVGLRFVRELEQGKETLRLDKVNQVLWLFGYEVGAVPSKREEE